MITRAVPLVANELLMPAQKGSRWGRAHQLSMGTDSYRDVVVGKPRDENEGGGKEVKRRAKL